MRKLVCAAVAAAILAGCSEETDKRGIEVLPDMFHTPAYKSQTAGEMQVDGRDAQGNPIRRTVQYPAMMAPPAGTIARDEQPQAADLAAARLLVDPLAPTPKVLRQGQKDFLTFCAPCHGRDGNAAHGYVAKQFSGIPSLNALSALQMPDGEIFHIIGNGRGRMMSLRAQLPAERRWGVVRFVKVQARAATLEQDVSTLLPYFDEELAKKPGDPVLLARRQQVIDLAAEAKADLAAISAVGEAHDYEPAPAAVPEYVGPSWPAPPEGSK